MIKELGSEFAVATCLFVSRFVSTVVQTNYTHTYLHNPFSVRLCQKYYTYIYNN